MKQTQHKECIYTDIIMTIKEIFSLKLHYHNAPGEFNLEIFLAIVITLIQ